MEYWNNIRIVSPLMMKWFPGTMYEQLGRPTGWMGRILGAYLFPMVNEYLELQAVCALKIQLYENVLEVGFGPGVGLVHVRKVK